jgi:hypothetical protein
MKISDFAMLPHLMRSVSCAARSPKAVAAAGTTISHSMLLRIDSQNFGSPNIWL